MADANRRGDRRQAWKRRLEKVIWEDADKLGSSARHAPRLPRFLPTLALLLLITLVAGYALFIALARLDGATIDLLHPTLGSTRGTDLSVVARTTITLGGLVAGIFAITYSYRKQRVEEAASRRADSESLSKRYQDAALQLAHESAPVRLAGAYSLNKLAVDWPEERQTCVSVLCSYLRVPPKSDQDDGDRQVRRTIQKLITSFMQKNIQKDLSEAIHFDLAGAYLHDFSLDYAHGHGMLDLSGSTITGDFLITNAFFEQGILIEEATLSACNLQIGRSRFGMISFDGSRVEENSRLALNLDDFNLVSLTGLQLDTSELRIAIAPRVEDSGLDYCVELSGVFARQSTISITPTRSPESGESFNVLASGGTLDESELVINQVLLDSSGIDQDSIKLFNGGHITPV